MVPNIQYGNERAECLGKIVLPRISCKFIGQVRILTYSSLHWKKLVKPVLGFRFQFNASFGNKYACFSYLFACNSCAAEICVCSFAVKGSSGDPGVFTVWYVYLILPFSCSCSLIVIVGAPACGEARMPPCWGSWFEYMKRVMTNDLGWLVHVEPIFFLLLLSSEKHLVTWLNINGVILRL